MAQRSARALGALSARAAAAVAAAAAPSAAAAAAAGKGGAGRAPQAQRRATAALLRAQRSREYTPLVVGVGVAGGALLLREAVEAYGKWAASPASKRYYEGGFQEKMTRREAAQILGIRESSKPDKVKETHRRVMLANHPDAGGSDYVASKINEAKDVLLKKGGRSRLNL